MQKWGLSEVLNMMQIVISNKSPTIKINAMEAPLTYFKIISQYFKLAIPMLRVRITTSLNDTIVLSILNFLRLHFMLVNIYIYIEA